MKVKPLTTFLLLLVITINNLFSQNNLKVNKTQSNKVNYTLPSVLLSDKGIKINSINKWEEIRRKEILNHFKNEVYGKIPGKIAPPKIDVIENYTSTLNNKAIRKQVKLTFEKNDKKIYLDLLMYTPKNKKKVPAFLAYNFGGNHKISFDTKIYLSNQDDNTKIKRGDNISRWPISKIIESGYGLITLNYNDVDPDKNDFSDGIHSLFYKDRKEKPKKNEWGSISAWAWGMSKVLDYLYTESQIDEKKIILLGHSRLGKTALWAGAIDQRFSIVISNNSGCGGAALSMRRFGEKISDINTNYPHWFAKNFHNYNNNESTLPVDQHMLIALIAPRPVYIASASLDSWADPKGEFLSAKNAKDVYNLYGFKEKELKSFPEVNSPIHGQIGYHLRKGKHDITIYDWDQYIKFSNLHVN